MNWMVTGLVNPGLKVRPSAMVEHQGVDRPQYGQRGQQRFAREMHLDEPAGRPCNGESAFAVRAEEARALLKIQVEPDADNAAVDQRLDVVVGDGGVHTALRRGVTRAP